MDPVNGAGWSISRLVRSLLEPAESQKLFDRQKQADRVEGMDIKNLSMM